MEAFIEETITVPIRLMNTEPGATYEFSPKLAELYVNLPQSAYGRFGTEDFDLVADLADFSGGQGADNLGPLRLERQPGLVGAVRFSPKVISCYLVEE